jgi:prophage regulatory protein
MAQLPETGFLRLKQIIGDKKTNIPALIPVSKSTWWAGSKSGRFPASVKLGPRTTAWSVEATDPNLYRVSMRADQMRHLCFCLLQMGDTKALLVGAANFYQVSED